MVKKYSYLFICLVLVSVGLISINSSLWSQVDAEHYSGPDGEGEHGEGTGGEGPEKPGGGSKVPPGGESGTGGTGSESGGGGITIGGSGGEPTTQPVGPPSGDSGESGGDSGGGLSLPSGSGGETGGGDVTPQAVQEQLTDLQKTLTTEQDPQQKNELLTQFLDQVRDVNGKSALNLTPVQQVTVLRSLREIIDKEIADAQKQDAPSMQQVTTGWNSWWQTAQSVVKTTVDMVAAGKDTVVNLALGYFKGPELLVITQQEIDKALEEALYESFGNLPLPTTETEYTNQQALLGEYTRIANTYKLDPVLAEDFAIYKTVLDKRLTPLGQVTALETRVKQNISSLPLAEQGETLLGLVQYAQDLQGDLSKGQFSADLTKRVTAVLTGLKERIATFSTTLEENITKLAQVTTVTEDIVNEVSALQELAQSSVLAELLGENQAITIQNSAAQALAQLEITKQKSDLATSIGTIKPVTSGASQEAITAFGNQIQEYYQAVLGLYDYTSYDQQQKLLSQLVDSVKQSTGLDQNIRFYLTGLVQDRVAEITKLLSEKTKPTPVNALDKQLNLFQMIPQDQVNSVQNAFQATLLPADTVITDIASWPESVKTALKEIITHYSLEKYSDQAVHLRALIEVPDLTNQESLALATASGITRASDIITLSSEESFIDQITAGFISLFTRAQQEIASATSRALTGLGSWFLKLGARLRINYTLEQTAAVAQNLNQTIEKFSGVIESPMLRKYLPASWLKYLDTPKTLASTSEVVAGIAEKGAAKTAFLGALGQKIQELGDALVSAGQKYTGTTIDVDAVIAQARQESATIVQEAGVSSAAQTALGDLVSGITSLWQSVTVAFAGADPDELMKQNFTNAQNNYVSALTEFKQFLGVSDTASAQEFLDAYKLMVQRASFRSYTDYEGWKLLKTKLVLLSRSLEAAGRAYAQAYTDVITVPAVLSSVLTNLAQDPISVPIKQALYQDQTVQITDVVNTGAQAIALQGALTDAQLTGINEAIAGITQNLTTLLTSSPLSSSSSANYAQALTHLITLEKQANQTVTNQAVQTLKTDVTNFMQKTSD